jgi:aspartyl-tRNA(Asn)/glutamyl-tRNA(Gln) amidotransferase subunit B
VLTGSKALAGYYEAVAAAVADRKAAANWVMGELSAALNSAGIGIESAPVSAVQLAGLINRVLDGTINQKTAKDVFAALWSREASSADAIIEARGLRQISDAGAIEKIIDEVLAAHPGPVAEFRAGKEKAFNSLVGQAMKATRGKANPQQLNDLLRRKLAG